MSPSEEHQIPLPDKDKQTIVAISSPSGHGALGVVRVSGPSALRVIQKSCRSKKKSSSSNQTLDFINRKGTLLLCNIYDSENIFLDEALVVFFKAPNSYTGEDTAEIFLHGNPILLRRMVYLAMEDSDVRLASAGEFTMRSYLNGKMDLTQAESIRRIIEARTEYELTAGQKILTGELSKKIYRFRSSLISLKAETEARVDFSDEDLTYETKEEMFKKITSLLSEIDDILVQSERTQKLVGGFQVALAGVPNAGKSSLLNVMLGWDRAIVSPVPGTTRDYVSEEMHLAGVSVRFVDTAGIRETFDPVEGEGVRRSKEAINRSQLILHIVDGSIPAYQLPDVHRGIPVLYIINKCDVLHENSWSPDCDVESHKISCRTGSGIDKLRELIEEKLFSDDMKSDPILLEDRHREHFKECATALRKTVELWSVNAPEEIAAIEIDTALKSLGKITGEITTEDILGRIFSMFCIGK